MKIFSILTVWILILSGCYSTDSLEIISIKPDLPGTLKTGQFVNVQVRYEIKSVENARIWVRPYPNGKKSKGFTAHASPLYDKGEGEIVGDFTVGRSAITDEIRVVMLNEGAGYISTISKPIEIKWED